jgi:hypothetical protein
MRIGEYEITHDGMCWHLRWGTKKAGKRGTAPKEITYWSNLGQIADAILDKEAAQASARRRPGGASIAAA